MRKRDRMLGCKLFQRYPMRQWLSLQRWQLRAAQEHRRHVHDFDRVCNRHLRRWGVLQCRLRRAVRVLHHDYRQGQLPPSDHTANAVHGLRPLCGKLRRDASKPKSLRVSGKRQIMWGGRKLHPEHGNHRCRLQWCGHLRYLDDHAMHLRLQDRRCSSVRHKLSVRPGPMRGHVR